MTTAWKVSTFVVFLVHIFLHSDWLLRVTSFLSLFSPNVEKYGPEKLLIRALFAQWTLHLFFYYYCFIFLYLAWKMYFDDNDPLTFTVTSLLFYIFNHFLSSTASVFLVVSFSSFIFSWTQAFLTVLLQWLSKKCFFQS